METFGLSPVTMPRVVRSFSPAAPPVIGVPRLVRLLAGIALTLAALAALAFAFSSPAGARAADELSGQQAGPVGLVSFQTFTCPDNYTGNTYLDDCEFGAPYEVTLTYPDGTSQSAFSAGDGTTAFFGGAAGQYAVTVGESADTNRFYYACFDGQVTYLFDGASNSWQVNLGAGDSLYCRFYVTPIVAAVPSPSAAPSAVPQNAVFTVQARLCPAGVDRTPATLLAECEGVDDVLIELSSDEGGVAEPAPAISTADGGFASFGVTAGTWTVALGVPGDFAEFYFACFDTTYGTEVFVKDGDTNVTTLVFEADTQTRCRFYIFPEDAGVPSASVAPSVKPSVAPSAAASVKPTARPSAGAVTGLPSTGTGDTAAAMPGAAVAWMILALIAAAAAAVAASSRRLVRR